MSGEALSRPKFPPSTSGKAVVGTGLLTEAVIKASTCLAQARIQANPSEVSAFLWLGPAVAAAVAASEDGTEAPGQLSQDLPPSVLYVRAAP